MHILTLRLLLITSVILLSTACSNDQAFDPHGRKWPDHVPRFTRVTAGELVGVALDEEGYVWAWGDSDFNGSTHTAAPVWNKDGTRFGKIKLLAASEGTAFAIDDEGILWAWGGDYFGVLGTPAPRKTIYPSPVVFPNGKVFDHAVSVACTGSTTVAVRDDGTVWVWGDNGGKLGRNYEGYLTRNPQKWLATDKDFEGFDDLKKFYLTYENGHQKLDGTPLPIQATDGHDKPLEGGLAVAAMFDHILLLKKDGTLWGWGLITRTTWPIGYNYEKNDDWAGTEYIPVQSLANQVAAPAKIVSISTAQEFSVALLDDGTVLTWGGNGGDALAHGEPGDISAPDRMRDTRNLRQRKDRHHLVPDGPILHDIQQIALSNAGLTLLDKSGRVWYQGSDFNGNGQNLEWGNVTDYPDTVPILVPVSHSDGSPFVNVKGIGSNIGVISYLIDEKGKLWAWGNNYRGGLGDGNYGSETSQLYPVPVKYVYFDDKEDKWAEYK